MEMAGEKQQPGCQDSPTDSGGNRSGWERVTVVEEVALHRFHYIKLWNLTWPPNDIRIIRNG